MPVRKAFIDSNVLLYLFSIDASKADRAEEIVRSGGVISVQVLNEITNVARRKFSMTWLEIGEISTLIQSLCHIEPLTLATHERGRQLAERYGLSVYDSMIAAAALLAGCDTLYSEDMHDGLLLEQQLRILNPFKDNAEVR